MQQDLLARGLKQACVANVCMQLSAATNFTIANVPGPLLVQKLLLVSRVMLSPAPPLVAHSQLAPQLWLVPCLLLAARLQLADVPPLFP